MHGHQQVEINDNYLYRLIKWYKMNILMIITDKYCVCACVKIFSLILNINNKKLFYLLFEMIFFFYKIRYIIFLILIIFRLQIPLKEER